jgi:predicted DNA-binding transcriptional regulator AlpA
MAQQFLSRTELAEYLGISKFTLLEMERTPGALPPAVIVGKSRKYNRAEIEKHFRPAEKESV